MERQQEDLWDKLRACTLCAEQFVATQSAHLPRPVFQGRPHARILIAGQAPGARVYCSGRPFTDPSGNRLRQWMQVEEDRFYDPDNIAILPMAFCFPGYDAKGADLPPPKICAATWRREVLDLFPALELTLLIGGYAQKWHLQNAGSVRETVANWRSYAPHTIPLPHPSWRNNAWLAKNSWFAEDLLPYLQRRIQEVLSDERRQ